MEQLKPVLGKYVDVHKKIAELNAEVNRLRDERRTLELDLAAICAEATVPEKIMLNSSHLLFSVKRPGEWKKGWTLSKRQLEEYLNEILPEHGPGVFREIVVRHERTLVGSDFSFDLKSTS
jgi:uncharacterized protein YhaN